MNRTCIFFVATAALAVSHGRAFAEGDVADVTAAETIDHPDWTQAIIDRPLTLDAGMFGLGGGVGTTYGGVAAIAQVGGAYGVTDRITLGASYEAHANGSDVSARGPVAIHALVRLAHGRWKAAANLDGVYDLASRDGGVSLGAIVSYGVTPTISLYTGGSQLSATLVRSDAMLPKPITLSAPVGVAWQPSASVYTYASTILASYGLKDAELDYLGDVTPLAVGLFVSPSRTLDLGLEATWLDGWVGNKSASVLGIGAQVRLYIM
jgi:hypothetical protein